MKTYVRLLTLALLLLCVCSCGKYAPCWGIFSSDTEKAMQKLADEEILDESPAAKQLEKHFERYSDKKETLEDYPYLVKLMQLSNKVPAETLEVFLNEGADLFATDDNGVSPMEYACKMQHGAWIDKLLNYEAEKGIHPSLVERTVCSDSSSLITLAVKFEDTALLDKLLKNHHAAAALADKAGNTPLMLAFEKGNRDIIEVLLDAGASPAQKNGSGMCPFVAAFQKQEDDLCLLFFKKTEKSDIPLIEGKPVLQVAFEQGRMPLFEQLIAAGCPVKDKGSDGSSLLLAACRQGNVKAVSLLLPHCAADFLSPQKTTPLMEACAQGNKEITELLLAKNVQVNVGSAEGNTPLMIAVLNEHENLLPPLLHAHANPDIGNAEGKTPLLVAAEKGKVEMVRMLLNGGADIRVADKAGRMPIDAAADETVSGVLYEYLGKSLLKQAESEEPVDVYNAALCYLKGIGTKKDAGKAKELLQHIEYRNFAPVWNLQAWLALAENRETNAETAAKLFEKSASRGSKAALQNWAYCRVLGLGCTRDAKAALADFREAAAAGIAEAAANAGLAAEQEAAGRDAHKHYAAAADRGNVVGLVNAGRCELLGCGGTKPDAQGGFARIKQAAEQGNETAKYNMALCYLDGRGVDAHAGKAYALLAELARAGHARAAYNAALLCESGNGTAQSAAQAAAYYEKAVAAGMPQAMYNLGRLYEKGRGVKEDTQKAFSLYEQAAENGLGLAHFAMGICYQKGIGTEVNHTRAMECLREAARNGDAAPLYYLGVGYLSAGQEAETQVDAPSELQNKTAEEKAVYYFRQAADKEFAPAEYELAESLRQGKGCRKDAAEAFRFYLRAATQGEPRAVYAVARCYHLGIGTDKNPRGAAEWYARAAHLGNAVAMYNYGEMLLHGSSGVKADAAAALKWLRSAAEKGYTPADYALGDCYYKGIATERNAEQAVKHYTAAAKAGDIRAMHNLGVCKARGEGTQKNEAAAYKLFAKAADKGYAPAQFNAAMCLLQNTPGVQPDAAAAVRLLRKAAEQGVAEARYNLACCCQQGEGTAKDEKEAYNLFRKLADGGHMPSVYRVGMCYATGSGVAKNTDEALKYLNKAARNGFPEALLNKGIILASVQGNYTAAAECFREAAKQGIAAAEYQYGLCLIHGRGCRPDIPAGLKLLNAAAEKDYAEAVFALGVLYGDGIPGIAPRPETATKYFLRAVALLQPRAEQGDAAAQTLLGCSYYMGLGVIINYTTAVSWFKKAAAQSNADAMYYLGLCYGSGKGVPRDSVPAKSWLKKAAELGHTTALRLLNE